MKVRSNFQKKLLMVELSWMNSDAQTEINMFLRATEMNPSSISLGGYFDVNRNLFKSVSQIITYNNICFMPNKIISVNIFPVAGDNGDISGCIIAIPNQYS